MGQYCSGVTCACCPCRTIVEHAVLFKFKDGYTEEAENGMYHGLWSFKEYFPSIMAMSLGKSSKFGIIYFFFLWLC